MTLSFSQLQAQLKPEWGREHDGNGVDFDLLMLPSLSVDPAQIALITGAHNYEERQLFSLIRLRDPGVRIIYVTSKLLPDLVVDAVLELLPDRDALPVEWLPIGVPSRLLAPERHGMPVATIPVAAVFEAACALLAVGPPLPSQTSLEVGAPALMYQAASGEAPLVTFLHDRI